MSEDRFFIMNEIDRPDEKHVVDKLSGKYLALELYGYNFTSFEGATPIKEFGLCYRRVSNGFIFTVMGNSSAKYKDGKTRKWQGAREFVYQVI